MALHDQLCDAVDGILYSADSPKSNAEHADELLEVLRPELEELEGDCIRLSEELDDARAANVELAKYARDAAHWETVADRMRDEIGRLRAERDRYRLAWISARRRAADESNYAMDALAMKDGEIARLRAALTSTQVDLRGDRMECVGTERDGETVYRLAHDA